MTKMCGNCGKTDHKYVDCPFIDMQFPPTKKEYAELKEKAGNYQKLKDLTGSQILDKWIDYQQKLKQISECLKHAHFTDEGEVVISKIKKILKEGFKN